MVADSTADLSLTVLALDILVTAHLVGMMPHHDCIHHFRIMASENAERFFFPRHNQTMRPAGKARNGLSRKGRFPRKGSGCL